jgi:hypothetical protein
MQRILASRALTDSHWAGRGTMNGFALSFRAKIRVKYDCGSLPKNRKKSFSYGEKRKEESAMATWISPQSGKTGRRGGLSGDRRRR